MRNIVSPLDGIRSPFGQLTSPLAIYAVIGIKPQLVFDFAIEKYFTESRRSTFDAAMTHTRSGNATMVDSDGVLKWAPHNLALNSATPATQSITVVSGADYTVECTGVSITLSGAGTGTVTEGNPVEVTASTTTLTLTVTGSTGTMWCYRSDLGGMVNNPDRGDSYVPTTDSPRYLPRRGHHVWNGSAWVNEGLLVESEARTNLLHTTNALVTQSYTVTAVPHTLHFTGTGTVTLSGASTDGPLVGTGTGEENRVYLTFTPTAGTLTLTVSGTVTDAQLEVGYTPSSYIPNLAGSGTVTRGAETLTVAAADLPWPTPRVIGPELVTNGTFDSDLSGWTENTSGVVTWSDGVALVGDGNGVINTFFAQTVPAVSGKTYEIKVDVNLLSGLGVRILLDSINQGGGAYFSSDQTFYYTATSSTIELEIYRFRAHDGQVEIDNISVREIDPLSVSIQMDGRVTFADTDVASSADGGVGEAVFHLWKSSTSAYIETVLDTNNGTGMASFVQEGGGARDVVSSTGSYYTPGVLVPFNIASRHGSTFINGAVDGTALTADNTPVALPDLSATDLNLAYDYNGTIRTFRMWNKDLTDEGLEEAST